MKKTKLFVSSLLIGAACVALTACGGKKESDENDTAKSKDSDSKTISIAISSDIVPSIERVEEPLKKLGYELDVHEFDDWVMPNTALAEGSVDCNFFEHEPYMEAYNQSKGTDLVMITPKIYSTPYGFFSDKYESLDEIGDGAKVAMSNEPSNRSRSLMLLQEAGLLVLTDEPKDEYYDEVDIEENPHNLSFVKADSNSLYSMISEVDLVIEPCDLVNNAGGDATDTLYREEDTKYAMGIAVRKGNENEASIQALNEAFHSDEFREAIEKDYPGVYQFVDEDE
ncbi:MetQ/NlpA family ABC transporter substrate-binding protein [Faecalicatena contorta]|uniref:D-methionine transport system substrate-binding protein n=1 Tax=Faecalicatena contorta TaxID=39482 RepID=A0A316A2S1_9FIRM|nr:MetQ/NlpA family ABC transporter substrate-binding protein [Faecalicatena contorta]PWJ51945.1 D-methionine transport system substrate-binding protein [Faecalicatena contorta]SUQ12223.1 D-methionine transport system substrate-binding protein [Faecalicatena contorta]